MAAVELVQDISFMVDSSEHLAIESLVQKLQALGDGTCVRFPEDWCRKMIEVVTNAHRLEIIFQFPVVGDHDDEVGYRVWSRRMQLYFRFFRKNERKPFHWFVFGPVIF